MDRTNPPPKGAILFIGSSTIRLWRTLAKDCPDHRVINRGFGGSAILDATHFADRIIFPYAPKMIFLRSGSNDLWGGRPPEKVFEDFQAFVAAVHAKLPETEIVYTSISPTLARLKQRDQEKRLNTLIEEYTRGKPLLKYVETAPMVLGADDLPRAELFMADKLHFNAAGYALLAEVVRPFLPPSSARKP